MDPQAPSRDALRLGAAICLCLCVSMAGLSASAFAATTDAPGSGPLAGMAQAYVARIDGRTVWSQRATQQLTNTEKLKQVRRNIARARALIHQKRQGGAA